MADIKYNANGATWPRSIRYLFLLFCFVTLLIGPFHLVRVASNLYRPIFVLQSVGEYHQDPSLRKVFKLQRVFHHGIRNDKTSLEFMEIPSYPNAFDSNAVGKPRKPVALAMLSKPTSIKISNKIFNSITGQSIVSQSQRMPKIQYQYNSGMVDIVQGPDVTDRETVINLAKMTSDAYYFDPLQSGWLNNTLGFNHSLSFGWEEDGLRGHIFADEHNDTIIVAFKGTSIDPREKSRTKDRLNDNQLFSCCCASQRPDPFWYGPVCTCQEDTYQCNSTCLTQTLMEKGHYYPTALQVMQNVSLTYPNSNLWVIGHSMGGAMASLMGLTYNIPAVSFEAPAEKLAAQRLGLTVAPGFGTFHFGNTADPIYMGACTGVFSTCSAAGYAFESQCFTGKRCVYDTVGDKGWHVNIANHRINTVISDVLEVYDNVPDCQIDDECVDCYNWNYDG